MNRKMFQNACDIAFREFQSKVPNPKTRGVGYYLNRYGNWAKCSTGNMAFNASKREYPYRGVCVIYVDEKIAPYVPYTNEVWISPRWKGHKNPNEGWFGRATEYVAHNLAGTLNGRVNKEK